MNTSNFQIQPDGPWLTLDAFMKMLTLRLARAMGISPCVCCGTDLPDDAVTCMNCTASECRNLGKNPFVRLDAMGEPEVDE